MGFAPIWRTRAWRLDEKYCGEAAPLESSKFLDDEMWNVNEAREPSLRRVERVFPEVTFRFESLC